MRRIFLTGGTGFLGSYLSYVLARKGFHLTLLVRPGRTQSGQEKFYSAVKVLWPDPDLELLKKRVVFLEGDISKENFGLKTDGKWDVLCHSAASTDFNETPEHLRKTNVEGARNMLKFLVKHKIPSLHHVSTAYAAGELMGRIKEKIQVPQSFRNLYEETKNQSERLCFSFCAENDLKLTIYRPSIIMGEQEGGRSLNFDGPYFFLKIFSKLARYAKKNPAIQKLPDGRAKLNIRLPIYGEDEQNLVPVDYVANFIAAVLEREPLEGKIYHLTNPEPPTVGDMNRVCIKLIPFDGMFFMGDQKILIDTEQQAFVMEKMRAYWTYLSPRMTFDKTNASQVERLVGLECPRLTDVLLERFFKFALDTNFGKHPQTKKKDSHTSHSKH